MLSLWIGTRGLARRLGLSEWMEAAALFVIFSCQMLYGASCHISNDALLIPWTVFFLNAVIDSFETPVYRRTALVAILMALGLLIKASLLVFLPLAFAARGALLIRRTLLATGILTVLAGPWYLRNVLLYHNLTGTVDTTPGIGPAETNSRSLFTSVAQQHFSDGSHGALDRQQFLYDVLLINA